MRFAAVVLVLVFVLGLGCAQIEEVGTGSSGISRGGVPTYAPAPSADYYAGEGQYVIKQSSITVKVPEGTLESRVEALRESLADEGAQISDVRYYEYSDRKQYTLTAKVSPAKFDSINSLVRETGDVKDLSMSTEDVTRQYVDLDIRIKSREVELGRLYELYNQSDNVSDLLAVERELTRVEAELESLKQQKEFLSSQIERSTIAITVYEDKPSTTQLALSLESLGAMFFGAVAAAISLLVLAAGFFIPLILVVGALWLAYKKLFGGKKGGPKPPEHKKIPPLE
ncbi:MAG: DUF4349 domain-containing protein [Candidatus Micrarchaeota archaeon]